MKTVNYYEVLGLNPSATPDEIRRAYRILARRYHPDLNPGKSSEERFKIIALAYQTLSEAEKKRAYDGELESARRIRAGFAAYERAQSHGARQAQNKAKQTKARPAPIPSSEPDLDPFRAVSSGLNKIKSLFEPKSRPTQRPATEVSVTKISVIEVSINMQDALFGGRKSVEIPSQISRRKISLRIPSGVRTGSVLRLRSGGQEKEEYVIIVRVAPHPYIELLPKGTLIEVPVSLSEALLGATIKVPGLEETESIVIPPGSQNGSEVRLSKRGVKFDDGDRGDLFYRINVQIPTSTQAVGLKEKIEAVAEYYETAPRSGFPTALKNGAR